MTSANEPVRRRKRPWIIGGSIFVVLVVAALIVAATVPRSTGVPTAGSTPTFTTTPLTPFHSATPTPLATATAKPEKSAPLPFTASGKVASGVTISVTKIEKVSGTASIPGEVAGPSIRFTIAIANSTAKSISLDTVAVNAYYTTAKTPALVLEKPGGKPFEGSVAAGASSTGVYVFNVPVADRSDVELTVDYTVNDPTIVFKGAIS